MDDSDLAIVEEDEKTRDPATELKSIEQQILQINREIKLLQVRKTRLEQRRAGLQAAQEQQQSQALAEQDWEGREYPWTAELQRVMRATFSISELRPQQLPAMNATLSGTHCILVMPTGGGKSLCYQLPALLSKGVTLVVSPLVSLIEDQVMGLRRRGLEAAMLSASVAKEQVNAVHTGLTDPKWPCKLLYVTPERLAKSKRLMAKLQKAHQMGRVSRVAIDEVHCCSQWGHDFRPDYKFLGVLQQTFPGVPLLGLTATATSGVITDVQQMLGIKGCLVLKASFNRPNLYYEVREKPVIASECVETLADLLKGRYRGQSGIIYTTTIKETEELVKELRARGVKVGPYHGVLDSAVRSKVHERWISNEYQAVVATIAFGMGIDKPDVRFVIHHSVSKSMENYYQESGRAGRDGQPADCLLFWRFADLFKQSTMVFTEQTGLEKLYTMLAYCIDATRCRRDLLSEHFDERWESTDCQRSCDHCKTPRVGKELKLDDSTKQLSDIIEHAEKMQQRLTAQKLVDAWQGRGAVNLRVASSTNNKQARHVAEAVVGHLLLDGCLKEDFHFTPYSTISYIVLGPKWEAGLSPTPLLLPGVRKEAPVTVLTKEDKLRATITKDKIKGSLDSTKTDPIAATAITSDKVAKSVSRSSPSSSFRRAEHSKMIDKESTTVNSKSENRKSSSSKSSHGRFLKNSGDCRDRSVGASSSSRSSDSSRNASEPSKKVESSKNTSEKRKRSSDNGDAPFSAPSTFSRKSVTPSSTRMSPSSKTNASDSSSKVSGTIDVDGDFVDFEALCPKVSAAAAAEQGPSSEGVNGASSEDSGAGVHSDALEASAGEEQPPKRRRVVTLDTSSDEDL